MALIIIRRAWLPTQPGLVSRLDRPASALKFTPECLAPGIDIDLLTKDTEVSYDMVEQNGQTLVHNLKPIGAPAAQRVLNKQLTGARDADEPDEPDAASPVEPPPSGPDARTALSERTLGAWPGPAPYTFVPVFTDENTALGPVEAIVLHDGGGSAGRLSGELQVELTALTPLLVGQSRYRWGDLRTADAKRAIPGGYNRKKMVLEPTFIELGTDGLRVSPAATTLEEAGWSERRAIIPGTSIKGSIRQAISAFMNAPMERVTERLFSYRPNVAASNVDKAPLNYFPAVVDRIYDDGAIRVTVIDGPNKVKFVESPRAGDLHNEANLKLHEDILNTLVPGELLPPASMQHYRIDNNRFLFDLNSPLNNRGGYRVLKYATGIDGNAVLAELAKDNDEEGEEPRFKHHFRALVLDADIDTKRNGLTIETDVVGQYQRTLAMLADQYQGHLSRIPGRDKIKNLDEIAKAVERNGPRPNQLIYVEARMSPQGTPLEIVSFGTHFRYRWAYADSVREVLIDPDTGAMDTRVELRPASGERIASRNDNFQHGKLTGARLLFGYTADRASGSIGIGDGSFARFAGRIAINHAIELVEPGKEGPESRFLYLRGLTGDARFLLPLRILGAPKPSAVEHYVQQDGVGEIHGATVTYGDLTGYGPKGGKLNGRKFYRHQPIGVPLGPLAGNESFLAENHDICIGDQAGLARLVSRPGTRYRFTVRFRDLRQWELGALLLAMQPDLIAGLPADTLEPKLCSVIDEARNMRQDDRQPLFALKMGYARPLGFGSVALSVASARLFADAGQLTEQTAVADWQHKAVLAFTAAMQDRHLGLIEWLQAIQIAGCTLADYPRANDGKVYTHHTNIRKKHAEERRAPQVQGDDCNDRPVWRKDKQRPCGN